MNIKEEIILNVLNEDISNHTYLMEHDRRSLAHTIALRLDAHDKSVLELKRKTASDDILAKLNLLKEIEFLYDELKKIPWYRLSARNIIKWKIRELDSIRLCGGPFKTDV